MKLLAVFVAAGLAAMAHAALAAPFSFDAAPGRLPKDVRPVAYRIAIVPDGPRLRNAGTESVVLDVRRPTRTIVFNSLNIRLSGVRFDDAPVKSVTSNDKTQLTTVVLAHTAAAGRHTLRFAYTGRIETGPFGLFYQHYVTPDGKHGAMLATQLESTDARRLFPGWDEPAFRATFQLTATVPSAWTAVGNMPVVRRTVAHGLATVVFAPTPPMPTYLVEFSAGPLARVSTSADGVSLGVWALKGQETHGLAALANARQILPDYDEYFGYRYPLPKLDSIAIPGGFFGGMENWGAIVYNDGALLVTSSSTLEDQQDIFSIQAHEMAHQWNGDLVTMGWWDDLWLNESFATWMSDRETDARRPSWHWWELQDRDKEDAMEADARLTSHPIHVAVHNENEAESAADGEITYSKGAAFLRMLETYLTPDVFRTGVRRYIRARAYSNATSDDLWQALSAASGRDVGALAAAWVDRPGFPLVTVSATCAADGARTIALQQSRFVLDGTDTSHTFWQIPLAVRSGTSGASTPVLFDEPGQVMPAGRCGEPLTVNAGLVGFYRVAYDAATTEANRAAFSHLADADRIALLDDQWALVSTGRAPLASYLQLARSMGNDNDARAWTAIAEAFETMERDERGRSDYAAFTRLARSIFDPLQTRLGFHSRPGEIPAQQVLRRRVLADLGTWGDANVRAYARKQFDAFLTNRSAISADDRETLLTIVALDADPATYARLLSIARTARTQSDISHLYTPLMAVRDSRLAARSLQVALSPAIPPQSDVLRMRFVNQVADPHPALAWQTFTRNYATLAKPWIPWGVMYIGRFTPQHYWRGVPLNRIAAFIRPRLPAENAADVDRGLESTRYRMRQAAIVNAGLAAYVALAR